MVRMEFSRLVVDERAEEQTLSLRTSEGEGQLSFLIGAFEAAALEEVFEERPRARPLTHDLLLSTLTTLGVGLRYVLLDDLVEGVFYSKLVLAGAGGEESVDARPSDAVALALRADVPIYATERLLRLAGARGD